MMTIVPQSFVGLMYEDGVFTRLLEPGKHKLKYHPFDVAKRSVELVDLREQSLVIKGQEILTQDKVAVRVSLLVYYRVVNAEAAIHEVVSYQTRIYEDVQLAARRFLAGRKLEAILHDRNEISDAVRQVVKDAALGYGVDIRRADIKDLVFPGNLREIMNQVLETDRRAEAKLIQARKDIEAQRLRAQAEHEATLGRLEAEREQLHLELQARKARAEAERDRRRIQLELEVEEAALAAQHPALLKLRELATMGLMAQAGAKFVIASDEGGLGSLVKEG